MGDVGPRIADVSVHFPHDTDVLVAVQKRVFVFALHAHAAGATTAVGGLVGLDAGIGSVYWFTQASKPLTSKETSCSA